MGQKVLILTAIPNGIRLDKEIREIEAAIRRAEKRDNFKISLRTAVSPQNIRRAITEERPHIVHFCGHGLEDGSLLLEDDGGGNKYVKPENLAELFKLHANYVQCVLLNACHSAKSATAISQHINYVIGINQEITDKAAIAFSQGFYDALGYEYPDNLDLSDLDIFQRAFGEALVAIQLEDISEGEVPVLQINEQQIYTYIKTQIVEISVDKITQQPLIKASPYKGLRRFNLGDREYFFGRDALIAKLFNAVNKSSFSLVLGASGSGKSSAVRAGLIPELKKSLESQKFYDFIFTPNQDPFESLYRCLLSEEKDYRFRESDVDFVREGKPNTLPQLISKFKKSEERWFLFIDQFEQLFIDTDLEKRNDFIQGIVEVAKKGDSSVRIILAMRSDFLEQFSFYPTLGAIANKNNIHLVTEMYPDELRQAIEQPAAKNGVVFEKGLVEQIVKEVEGQKGYLPLLQYTLDLLWEKECTTKAADGHFHIEDRTLNKTSYVALGRVRGVLQKRVDEIYTEICEKNENGELVTKQIFLKLVNIIESDSKSRAVSRRAYSYEFVGESITNILRRFINENLLVSSYEYSSEEKLLVGTTTKPIQRATIEIAHEILISSWDELKLWLKGGKEAIFLKNWLAGETRRWLEVQAKDESKANDELLRGSRLEQIVAFRENNTFEMLGGLAEQENKFIDTSIEWRDRLQKEVKERRKRQFLPTPTFITSFFFGTDRDKNKDLEKIKKSEDLKKIE